uniref:Cilia and flagella associated protein 74 n=1 Tax=Sphenodon punctatus TaxID=8508 RepID=A0A8D0GUN6_SPHPU
ISLTCAVRPVYVYQSFNLLDSLNYLVNGAAVFRLQAMHRRLCTELGNEKDLESKIALMLKENVIRVICVLLLCRKEMEAWEDYERRHQKALEDAQRNRKNAIQFLKTTVTRIRQKEAKEELKSREHMEKRMHAVLSLKNNITSNRVLLQLLRSALRTQTELFVNTKQLLLSFCMLMLSYREFMEQQKSRKIEIVAQILKEEAKVEKMKKQKSCKEHLRSQGKLPDSIKWRIKTWQYIEKTCKDPGAAVLQVSKAVILNQELEKHFVFQICRGVGVPKDETDAKPLGASKLEKEIFAQNLEKLRSGFIRKQVVSCREFKGCPFYSKPSLIHFKVGAVLHCLLLLKERHPLISTDLEGKVTFLSQIGSFSIPLKCTTKKCVLALDKELIDFGTHVVGETISRTITLTNCGALGTRFQLQTSADADPGGRDGLCSTELVTYGWCLISLLEQHSEELCTMETDLQEENAPIQLEPPPEEEPIEITLGEVTEGEIGPFDSVKLQIIFIPTVPGDVHAEFVITFDNPDCKPLFFSVIGVSVDVPVWVPNSNVNLKICMYDRLYQDCIIIRTKAALRLKFEVCKELSNHMELLPKTGYIQAQSSFSVQLKFLPRHSLPKDAGRYFDQETGVLEVPMTILVFDQTKPVEFTVHAIVTTSDFEISPTEVNFGYCTIYEAVQTTITLMNKAILPQEFGFVGLPEFVEIQPNDGFGTVLPLERLNLDIIFKANKAKEYSFELTCKSEINRQFKLSCKAVGVHPPLELSHSLVQFAATALNDVSTATLYVINSHVSLNQFTHGVPRIGKGEIAPVGPTSFQFLVPEDSPVTIMPSVGTVLPGKKCLIQASFRPVLSDQHIRKEAVMLLCRGADAKALPEKKARETDLQVMRIAFQCALLVCHSEEYTAAQRSLIRNFRGKFERYIIPCFVASGDIDEKREAENLNYSPYNTLYLELYCPAVAPSVVVTSDNGKNIINFEEVAVGHRKIKRASIQNISQQQLALEFSILNPYGPFLLLNPIGSLESGETQSLFLSFSPDESKMFFETLDIRSVKATLTLSVIGHGVAPSITCSVEGGVLNMGYVIAKEKATSTFKIQSTSTLPLKYSIQLESLSPTREREQQKLPPFITAPRGRTEIVGTQNYSGLSVFSIFPVEGVIEAGKSQDFTVVFSPDHESLYYSDCFKVVLFGKEVAHVIQLKGAARNHMMFVEGGDPLDVPTESLALTTSLSEEVTRGGNVLPPTSYSSMSECQWQGFVINVFKNKPDHPMTVAAGLTLKGDIKECYNILFTAKVVSTCAPTKTRNPSFPL